MRIITVNLPETYIKQIDGMIGDERFYPSRSELIRVAVREFLIQQLTEAEQFLKAIPATIPGKIKKIDNQMVWQINGTVKQDSVEITSENGDEVEIKTYHILSREEKARKDAAKKVPVCVNTNL